MDKSRNTRSARQTPQALSDKEKTILELIVHGCTAREAAEYEEMAVRTVERHIENLRLKFNARNTTHLVACAYSAGVLKVVRGVTKIA